MVLGSQKGHEMYEETISLIEHWEAKKLSGKRGKSCSRAKSILSLKEAQRLVSKSVKEAHNLSFRVWKKNFYKTSKGKSSLQLKKS